MKIKKIDNEVLQYKLKDRDEVFEGMIYLLDPDDEQLAFLKKFFKKYEKDIRELFKLKDNSFIKNENL